MKPSRRTLILLTSLLLAALAVGVSIIVARTDEKRVMVSPSTQTAEDINLNPYDVSPPSKGRFHETVAVTLGTRAGSASIAFLPHADAASVQAAQSVFLYDKEDLFLSLVGTVREVRRGGPEGLVTVVIDIPSAYDIAPDAAVAGEIITRTIPFASRLPLTALQRDTKGGLYLWRAQSDRPGTTRLTKQYLSGMTIMADTIAFQTAAGNAGTYVLSPDEKLAEGQILQAARKVLYSAPSEPDPAQISAIPHAPPAPEPEAAPAPASGACGTGSSACGGSGGNSFVDKMIQMAKDRKASPP